MTNPNRDHYHYHYQENQSLSLSLPLSLVMAPTLAMIGRKLITSEGTVFTHTHLYECLYLIFMERPWNGPNTNGNVNSDTYLLTC